MSGKVLMGLGKLLLRGGLHPIKTVGAVAGGATTLTAGAAAVDHFAFEGEGRGKVWDRLTDWFQNGVDNKAQQGVYELLAPMLGWEKDASTNPAKYEEDRKKFQEKWDAIEPASFVATLAALKTAEFGLEKTLGMDLVSNQSLFLIAAAYHFLVNTDLGEKALNWVKGQSWARDMGLDQGIDMVKDSLGNFNAVAAGDAATSATGAESKEPEMADAEVATSAPPPVVSAPGMGAKR